MENNPDFIERQYLGRDYSRISIRLVMALFCFAAYFITEDRELNADLFLVLGCSILVVSVIMMFMLHYRTTVHDKSVIINGSWSSRLVKIDLNSIIKVERKSYSSYAINNPVYNLHQKGKIRFYAGGKEAIWLTDRAGLQYVIGSQSALEFEQAIRKAMQE